MHQIDCKGKYFTKKLLIEANNASIRENRNRQLNEKFLEKLPSGNIFQIALAFDEHNRGEIRVQIMFDDKGTTGFLDMTKNRYNLLPQAIFNEDGTVTLETKEDLKKRRLYPDGREYVETTVRKTIRSKSFRKKVLDTYGHKCAICSMHDDSALDAAHIYPVQLCNDDSVNNGLCLCSNHHRAFEQGKILIKPDYHILVRDENYIEFNNAMINLPASAKDFPSTTHLKEKLGLSLKKENK